jgi:hypothetical protein
VTRYRNRQAVLATKHHKEKAIAGPMRDALGLSVVVPPGLDTDLLGTFSGEVERQGTPSAVVVRKARFGMAEAGLALGIASEGSFRPHAELAFAVGCHELMAFVDDEDELVVVEELFTLDTNFANAKARTPEDLSDFIGRVGFPDHALIAVPNDRIQIDHDDRVRLVLEDVPEQQLFKGLADHAALAQAVAQCAALSTDGLVHVETDMRAHLNPTRMHTIATLALRLARRLATPCPACGSPGWGRVAADWGRGAEGGLVVVRETMGCARCAHREVAPSAIAASPEAPSRSG